MSANRKRGINSKSTKSDQVPKGPGKAVGDQGDGDSVSETGNNEQKVRKVGRPRKYPVGTPAATSGGNAASTPGKGSAATSSSSSASSGNNDANKKSSSASNSPKKVPKVKKALPAETKKKNINKRAVSIEDTSKKAVEKLQKAKTNAKLLVLNKKKQLGIAKVVNKKKAVTKVKKSVGAKKNAKDAQTKPKSKSGATGGSASSSSSSSSSVAKETKASKAKKLAQGVEMSENSSSKKAKKLVAKKVKLKKLATKVKAKVLNSSDKKKKKKEAVLISSSGKMAKAKKIIKPKPAGKKSGQAASASNSSADDQKKGTLNLKKKPAPAKGNKRPLQKAVASSVEKNKTSKVGKSLVEKVQKIKGKNLVKIEKTQKRKEADDPDSDMPAVSSKRKKMDSVDAKQPAIKKSRIAEQRSEASVKATSKVSMTETLNKNATVDEKPNVSDKLCSASVVAKRETIVAEKEEADISLAHIKRCLSKETLQEEHTVEPARDIEKGQKTPCRGDSDLVAGSSTVGDKNVKTPCKAEKKQVQSPICLTDTPCTTESKPELASSAESKPEPVSSAESKPEPVSSAESKPEPVSSAESKMEPVSSAECKPEPVSSAECKPEPVSSAECKPEPVSSAECKPEPVSSAECKPEPAPSAESKPEPAPSAESKPEPAPSAESKQEPASSATSKLKTFPSANISRQETAPCSVDTTNETSVCSEIRQDDASCPVEAKSDTTTCSKISGQEVLACSMKVKQETPSCTVDSEQATDKPKEDSKGIKPVTLSCTEEIAPRTSDMEQEPVKEKEIHKHKTDDKQAETLCTVDVEQESVLCTVNKLMVTPCTVEGGVLSASCIVDGGHSAVSCIVDSKQKSGHPCTVDDKPVSTPNLSKSHAENSEYINQVPSVKFAGGENKSNPSCSFPSEYANTPDSLPETRSSSFMGNKQLTGFDQTERARTVDGEEEIVNMPNSEDLKSACTVQNDELTKRLSGNIVVPEEKLDKLMLNVFEKRPKMPPSLDRTFVLENSDPKVFNSLDKLKNLDTTGDVTAVQCQEKLVQNFLMPQTKALASGVDSQEILSSKDKTQLSTEDKSDCKGVCVDTLIVNTQESFRPSSAMAHGTNFQLNLKEKNVSKKESTANENQKDCKIFLDSSMEQHHSDSNQTPTLESAKKNLLESKQEKPTFLNANSESVINETSSERLAITCKLPEPEPTKEYKSLSKDFQEHRSIESNIEKSSDHYDPISNVEVQKIVLSKENGSKISDSTATATPSPLAKTDVSLMPVQKLASNDPTSSVDAKVSVSKSIPITCASELSVMPSMSAKQQPPKVVYGKTLVTNLLQPVDGKDKNVTVASLLDSDASRCEKSTRSVIKITPKVEAASPDSFMSHRNIHPVLPKVVAAPSEASRSPKNILPSLINRPSAFAMMESLSTSSLTVTQSAITTTTITPSSSLSSSSPASTKVSLSTLSSSSSSLSSKSAVNALKISHKDLSDTDSLSTLPEPTSSAAITPSSLSLKNDISKTFSKERTNFIHKNLVTDNLFSKPAEVTCKDDHYSSKVEGLILASKNTYTVQKEEDSSGHLENQGDSAKKSSVLTAIKDPCPNIFSKLDDLITSKLPVKERSLKELHLSISREKDKLSDVKSLNRVVSLETKEVSVSNKPTKQDVCQLAVPDSEPSTPHAKDSDIGVETGKPVLSSINKSTKDLLNTETMESKTVEQVCHQPHSPPNIWSDTELKQKSLSSVSFPPNSQTKEETQKNFIQDLEEISTLSEACKDSAMLTNKKIAPPEKLISEEDKISEMKKPAKFREDTSALFVESIQPAAGKSETRTPSTLKIDSHTPPTGKNKIQTPPTAKGEIHAPPTKKGEVQAPPTTKGDVQAPPTTKGDVQAPPTAKGDVQAPPTAKGDIQAPPTAKGDIQAPPTAKGDIHTPPTAKGDIHAPPTAKGDIHAPPTEKGVDHAPPTAKGDVRAPPTAKGDVRAPPTTKGEIHAPPTTKSEVRAPPTTKGEIHAPPTTKGEIRAPPTTKGEIRAPPTTKGEIRAPPTTKGEIRAPPTTKGEIHAPPTTKGEIHAPPTTKGEIHAPPTTKGEIQAPPTTKGEIQAPPTTKGEIQAPPTTKGEIQAPPTTKGEIQAPPTTKGEIQAPLTTTTKGEIQALPTRGGIQALPTRGDIQALPTRGDIQALPTRGGIQALPTRGDIQALPTRGDIQALPTRGDIQALPTRGDIQALPPRGDIQALPPRGDIQALPPKGDIQALPPKGDIPPSTTTKSETLTLSKAECVTNTALTAEKDGKTCISSAAVESVSCTSPPTKKAESCTSPAAEGESHTSSAADGETRTSPAADCETRTSPAADGESHTSPAVYDETRTSPAADGETRTSPAADGETRTSPAADGETRTSPAADGETRTSPAADGETRTSPAADGETRTSPAADGETRTSPAADGETCMSSAPESEIHASLAEKGKTCASLAKIGNTCASLAAKGETYTLPTAAVEGETFTFLATTKIKTCTSFAAESLSTQAVLEGESITTETTQEGESITTETTQEGESITTETTQEGESITTETTQEGESITTETTQEGESLTKPAAQGGESLTKPAAQGGESLTKPAAQGGESLTKPAAQGGESLTKPAAQGGESLTKPAAQGGESLTKPAAQGGESLTKPAAQGGESLTKPAAQGGESLTKPAAQGGESLTKPAAQGGESLTKPAAQGGESLTKPAALEGESRTSPATTDGEIHTSPTTAESEFCSFPAVANEETHIPTAAKGEMCTSLPSLMCNPLPRSLIPSPFNPKAQNFDTIKTSDSSKSETNIVENSESVNLNNAVVQSALVKEDNTQLALKNSHEEPISTSKCISKETEKDTGIVQNSSLSTLDTKNILKKDGCDEQLDKSLDNKGEELSTKSDDPVLLDDAAAKSFALETAVESSNSTKEEENKSFPGKKLEVIVSSKNLGENTQLASPFETTSDSEKALVDASSSEQDEEKPQQSSLDDESAEMANKTGKVFELEANIDANKTADAESHVESGGTNPTQTDSTPILKLEHGKNKADDEDRTVTNDETPQPDKKADSQLADSLSSNVEIERTNEAMGENALQSANKQCSTAIPEPPPTPYPPPYLSPKTLSDGKQATEQNAVQNSSSPSSEIAQPKVVTRPSFVVLDNCFVCVICCQMCRSKRVFQSHIWWHFHVRCKLCNHCPSPPQNADNNVGLQQQQQQPNKCPYVLDVMLKICRARKKMHRSIVRSDADQSNREKTFAEDETDTESVDLDYELDNGGSGGGGDSFGGKSTDQSLLSPPRGQDMSQSEKDGKSYTGLTDDNNSIFAPANVDYLRSLYSSGSKKRAKKSSSSSNAQNHHHPHHHHHHHHHSSSSSSSSSTSSSMVAASAVAQKKGSFYVCGFHYCSYSCMNCLQFRLHLQQCHNFETVFPCYHCGQTNYSKDDLIKHMYNHSNARDFLLFRCHFPRCRFGTNMLQEFHEHNNIFHVGELVFTCFYCSTEFSELSQLLAHLQANLLKFVQCPHCTVKDRNRRTVLNHISTEHPLKPKQIVVTSQVVCKKKQTISPDQSLENSQHQQQVNLHRSLSEDRVLECIKCGLLCRNIATLRKHSRVCLKDALSHKKSFASSPKENHWTLVYSCQWCSFPASSDTMLFQHTVDQHPGKNANFEQIELKISGSSGSGVDSKLSSSSWLEAAKSGAFICPYCKVAFHNERNWSEHMEREHNGDELDINGKKGLDSEIKYPCDFCEFHGTSEQDLVEHQQIMTATEGPDGMHRKVVDLANITPKVTLLTDTKLTVSNVLSFKRFKRSPSKKMNNAYFKCSGCHFRSLSKWQSLRHVKHCSLAKRRLSEYIRKRSTMDNGGSTDDVKIEPVDLDVKPLEIDEEPMSSASPSSDGPKTVLEDDEARNEWNTRMMSYMRDKQMNLMAKEGILDCTDSEGYRCSICRHTGKTMINIRQHLWKTHLKLKPVTCPCCPFTSWKNYTLEKHKISKHKHSHPNLSDHEMKTLAQNLQGTTDGLIECQLCFYKSPSSYKVRTHIWRTHMHIEMKQCSLCAYKCWYLYLMNMHQLSRHKSDTLQPVDEKPSKVEKEVVNDGKNNGGKVTNDVTDNISNLIGNSSIMSDEDMSLSAKGLMEKKSGSKYECCICRYECTRIMIMKIHIWKRHLNIKQRRCPQCPYICWLQSRLEQHVCRIGTSSSSKGSGAANMEAAAMSGKESKSRWVISKADEFGCKLYINKSKRPPKRLSMDEAGQPMPKKFRSMSDGGSVTNSGGGGGGGRGGTTTTNFSKGSKNFSWIRHTWENSVTQSFFRVGCRKLFARTTDRVNQMEIFTCVYCSYKSWNMEAMCHHTYKHKLQCGYCLFRAYSRKKIMEHIEEFHQAPPKIIRDEHYKKYRMIFPSLGARRDKMRSKASIERQRHRRRGSARSGGSNVINVDDSGESDLDSESTSDWRPSSESEDDHEEEERVTRYCCCHCSMRTHDFDRFRKHVAKHSRSTEELQCPTCVYRTRDAYKFHQHIRRHPSEHFCGYCNFSSMQESFVQLHVRRVHPKKPVQIHIRSQTIAAAADSNGGRTMNTASVPAANFNVKVVLQDFLALDTVEFEGILKKNVIHSLDLENIILEEDKLLSVL